MPISDPGSSLAPRAHRAVRGACAGQRQGTRPRGFTLLELLVVLSIVALAIGTVVLTMRDGLSSQLEREGERLSALLEMARAEARMSGTSVLWVPAAQAEDVPFRFVGLPASRAMPTRWLDDRVSAQVAGRSALVLGPDAILPAQRIVLRLADRRLDLATDGLGPFAVASAASAAEGGP